MSIEKENIKSERKENKPAKKFVKFLHKNEISVELLPIYYNDNNHAMVVLNDKTDDTGYPYNWEVIFNPAQDIVVIKAVRIADKIQSDLLYHVLDILNDKNRSILWGKFFIYDNAVFMMAPITNIDSELKSSYILNVIKAMRQSVEEVHNAIMKVSI